MKTYKREAYEIKFTVVETRYFPPEGFGAVNLGLIFVRDIDDLTGNLLRHEAIHTLQAREMLYVFHLLLYGLEFVVKWCICRDFWTAYRSISTEQEAYNNSWNLNYRRERRRFAFRKYIFTMYKNRKT